MKANSQVPGTRVRTRLLAGMLTIVALLAGAAALMLQQQRLVWRSHQLVDGLALAESFLLECRRQEKNFLLRRDRASIDLYSASFDAFLGVASDLEVSSADAEDRSRLRLLQEKQRDYDAAFQRLARGWSDSKLQRDRIEGEMVSGARECHALLADLRRDALARYESARKTTRVVVIAAPAMAVLLTFLIAGLLTMRIAGPLDYLRRIAERLGNGEIQDMEAGLEDLETKRFRTRETQELKEAFQQMLNSTVLMFDAAETAGGSLELEQVLSRVARSFARALRLPYCRVFLWEEEQGEFYPRASSGEIDDDRLKAALQQPLAAKTDCLLKETLAAGAPVATRGSEPRCVIAGQPCEALGVTALAAVPVRVADRVLAVVVGVATEEHHKLEPRNLRLARGIANVVAPVVDNAMRYADAQLQLAHSHRLQRSTAALLDIHGLQDVLRIVCHEAQQLTGSEGSAIFLRDQSGKSNLAYRSGTAAAGGSELSSPASSASRSELSFPLRVKGDEIGTLLLTGCRTDSTEEERRVTNLFAYSAAIAIEHALFHIQHERLAVLEERQRLAHELHDSVAQSLYGVTMYGEAAGRLLEAGKTSKVQSVLRELRDTSLEALREMRLMVFELRPPVLEEGGLSAALQTRLAAVEGRAGLRVEFAAEGVESVPTAVAESLYWIATEALNNVVKHAKASQVTVRLRGDDSKIHLEIVDDGAGFDLESAKGKGGLGLLGMHERIEVLKGELSVTSSPGHGTRVAAKVPLESREEQPIQGSGDAP